MRRARIPHDGVRRVRGLAAAVGAAAAGCCARAAGRRLPPSLDSSPRPVARAQDPSTSSRRPTRTKIARSPRQPGGMFGPTPKIDQAQPLYLQADQLIYDTKSNRVIAQGNVEIYYNNYILTADQVVYDQNANKLIAEGNAQLKDPERQHHPGRPVRGARRFPRCLRPVAQRRHRGRHAHRRRARQPPGRQHHRIRARPGSRPARTTPACRRCGASAPRASSTISRRPRITYQDAQFELFGVPSSTCPTSSMPDPSVKRQSGFLMPSFSNSSTLGFGSRCPTTSRSRPNYDFTFHPEYFQATACCGRASGATASPTASTRQVRRHRPGRDGTPSAQATIEGWRGSHRRPRASSRCRRGGASAGTSRSKATTASAASIKLDPILQTDRVNTVYLQGMSDRNYFGAKLYQFGGLLLTIRPTPIPGCIRSSTTTTSSASRCSAAS